LPSTPKTSPNLKARNHPNPDLMLAREYVWVYDLISSEFGVKLDAGSVFMIFSQDYTPTREGDFFRVLCSYGLMWMSIYSLERHLEILNE